MHVPFLFQSGKRPRQAFLELLSPAQEEKDGSILQGQGLNHLLPCFLSHSLTVAPLNGGQIIKD